MYEVITLVILPLKSIYSLFLSLCLIIDISEKQKEKAGLVVYKRKEKSFIKKATQTHS